MKYQIQLFLTLVLLTAVSISSCNNSSSFSSRKYRKGQFIEHSRKTNDRFKKSSEEFQAGNYTSEEDSTFLIDDGKLVSEKSTIDISELSENSFDDTLKLTKRQEKKIRQQKERDKRDAFLKTLDRDSIYRDKIIQELEKDSVFRQKSDFQKKVVIESYNHHQKARVSEQAKEEESPEMRKGYNYSLVTFLMVALLAILLIALIITLVATYGLQFIAVLVLLIIAFLLLIIFGIIARSNLKEAKKQGQKSNHRYKKSIIRLITAFILGLLVLGLAITAVFIG